MKLPDSYTNKVQYECKKGSQFDTNKDGKGDTLQFELQCRWNKLWTEQVDGDEVTAVPVCRVTHCVDPIIRPDNGDRNLLEATSDPTEVGDFKIYDCETDTKIENETDHKSEASNTAQVIKSLPHYSSSTIRASYNNPIFPFSHFWE